MSVKVLGEKYMHIAYQIISHECEDLAIIVDVHSLNGDGQHEARICMTVSATSFSSLAKLLA